MVKQILQSSVDEQCLEKLTNSGSYSVGVIVGHSTESDKDYIAGYIECPNKVGTNASVPCTGISDIDDAWFSAYASQIALNLPGGISIIGTFICAKQADVKEVSTKLRTLAYRTFKLVSSIFSNCLSFSVDQRSTTWTLIHFNKQNAQTVSARQYDVSDYKDVGQLVELKRLNHDIGWSNLKAVVNINQYATLPSNKLELVCFHQLCTRVSQAHVILNNESCLESKILVPLTSQSGKSSKNKKTLKKDTAKVFQCQVYLPSSNTFASDRSKKIVGGSFKVQVEGCILASAFVPPGSTAKIATDALKADIIRSVQQRCLILSDGQDEMEGQRITSFYQLPMRVLAKDAKNPVGIDFSEYLIQGEPVSDCVERFRDLSGITVTEEEMTQECFKEIVYPAVENLSNADDNGVEEEVVTRGSVDSKVMAMLIAAVAVAVALFLLISKS